MINQKHYGYFVFGKDMLNVDLTALHNNGVTDLFLNYYAFTVHGETKVAQWIQKAKNNQINIHIWMQCFYDGEWHNPKTTNTSSKIKEARKYATMKNVTGVHLDYLRYPGNAYKTNGGAEAITEFVKTIRKQNPNTFLSCAIMPEDDGKYYYGQDHEALGKIVNALIPMQYKGNYNAGTEWLKNTTKKITQKATIWSALQVYKSDNNPTLLTSTELQADIKTCTSNGAQGAILFRYGLSPQIQFTTTTTEEKMTTYKEITQLASAIKTYIEKNHKFPTSLKVGSTKYTYGQMAYLLSTSITSIGKEVTNKTVKNAPKSTGANLNEKIYASDYKDQAKRVSQYIKQHGTCPNYVTTVKSKKQARPRDFIYAFARIIVYYNKNKAWPNYALYNSGAYTTTKSSTSSKSNGLNAYITSQGCSGMGQCTGYYCACNSLQQCFYRLTGIKVAESTIARVAGTTTSGTDHAGINTAVAWFNKKYGKNIKITWKNFSDLGSSDSARWSALQSYINKGAVFCHLLYRDQWGHYEVPKNVSNDTCQILNSLGDSCGSGTYCGYIESRSRSTQKRYIQGISQKSIAILTKG